MQHLTLSEKNLLIGDEVARLLMSYAASVAQRGGGDHVSVNALGIDGEEVTAQILLNSGTNLVVESTASSLPEPGNADVERYMQERLDSFRFSPGMAAE